MNIIIMKLLIMCVRVYVSLANTYLYIFEQIYIITII